MKRNPNIAFLKVLACCAVVALHSQRDYTLMIIHNPFLYYISRFAIPIFFMVNGYLITQKERNTKYYIKKVLKMVLFVFAWSFIWGIAKKTNPFKIFCLSIFSKGTIAIFWFFWALAILYLIWALIGKRILDSKRLCNFALVTLLFTMIALDIISCISIYEGGIFVQKAVPQTFRIWTWMFYFIMGYKLNGFVIKNAKKYNIILFATTIIAILYQYLVCNLITGIINSEYLYDNIFIIIWSISIFCFAMSIKFKKEKLSKFIFEFEKNTIGIYALHIIFIKLFKLTYHTNGLLYSTIIWILLILVSLVISMLINKVKYLNNLIKL